MISKTGDRIPQQLVDTSEDIRNIRNIRQLAGKKRFFRILRRKLVSASHPGPAGTELMKWVPAYWAGLAQ